MSTAATAVEHGLAAATAVASAAATVLLCLRSTASATIAVAAAVTAGLRCGRACDRQSGDARGEKQPGHAKSPLGQSKRSVRRAVPTLKRMEPAL
jgi:hypothetical protein